MRTKILTAAIALVPALALVAAPGPAAASYSKPATTAAAAVATRPACAAPAPGRDECLALLRTAANGKPISSATSPTALPFGYGPPQLQSAYALAAAAAAKGNGQTVALVDAYDDPNAENDLAAYRAAYGLPACTSASGCFRKVNQDGAAAPLPAASTTWAVEESLDIDMVSAICPLCHIILAEANDNQDYDLAATVATAAKLGATQISNSYGEPEYPGETRLEPFYSQPGVAVTAAGGDSGYGVLYPAASANVTAVGGTTLWPASNSRGWTESVWAATGSGCSTQIPKPAWQHDPCSHRSDNDVAAVADPATGVAFYDTFGQGGWEGVGGTSVSSPIVAAVYALLGSTASAAGASYFYTHPRNVFDVTAGVNGSCNPAYLCSAGPGYDGPTGLGSPDVAGAPLGSGDCTNGWSPAPQQPAPNLTDLTEANVTFDTTAGVAALSPSSVWTAGTYLDNQQPGPVATLGWVPNIEHWNGSGWSQTPSPDPVTGNGDDFATTELRAVSFDRPDDGWAVGNHDSGQEGDGDGSPMVDHWDGTRWSLSPVLYPTASFSDGNGNTSIGQANASAVAAVAPDDVWLAGYFLDSSGNENGSFIEHWDGSTWSVVSFPDQRQVALQGLYAASATGVWAVGLFDGTDRAPIVLHWDGRTWSAETSPIPSGHEDAVFSSVSGTSPDDVWAVGDSFDISLGQFVPLAEHWDGQSWSAVPIPFAASTASHGTYFAGVAAISPADAWAVGEYQDTRDAQNESFQYLLAHWDGQSWQLVGAPQASTPHGFIAVSASSANNVWITGRQQWGVYSNSSGYSATYGSYIVHNGCSNG